MNNFNSKFDLNYAILINYDTMNEWEISGIVSDNSGTYFPSDSQVGDIIYIDSYEGIKRYVVTKIIAAGSTYSANIKWDMPEKEPFEPLSGYQGLIGASTGKLKLTSLTSWTVNGLSESFINSIKNYESNLIENGTLNSPNLDGKPTAPTADISSNDTQIATTEWVNNKLESINIQPTECEGEVKEFITGQQVKRYDLLYLTKDNTVKLCDVNNIDCADSIVGIALDDSELGQKVNVLMEGIITNEKWNFSVYPKTLFAGLNGEIIEIPNQNHKFMQQIGLAIDNKTINLEIEESIIL